MLTDNQKIEIRRVMKASATYIGMGMMPSDSDLQQVLLNAELSCVFHDYIGPKQVDTTPAYIHVCRPLEDPTIEQLTEEQLYAELNLDDPALDAITPTVPEGTCHMEPEPERFYEDHEPYFYDDFGNLIHEEYDDITHGEPAALDKQPSTADAETANEQEVQAENVPDAEQEFDAFHGHKEPMYEDGVDVDQLGGEDFDAEAIYEQLSQQQEQFDEEFEESLKDEI